MVSASGARNRSAPEVTTLKDDVLGPGVARIAEYAPDDERRIRHLIRAYDFPHFHIGQLIYSKKSWVDRYYSGEQVVTNGQKQRKVKAAEVNGTATTPRRRGRPRKSAEAGAGP
jgi:hypothetical protein